jgi:hypothetical protein
VSKLMAQGQLRPPHVAWYWGMHMLIEKKTPQY